MKIQRNRELKLKDPEITLASEIGLPFERYRADFRYAEEGNFPSFPLHLDLDLSTRCNLRCPMCPAGGGGGDLFPGLRVDLPFHLYEMALKEASFYSLPSVRLGMTGEPLLVKGIEKYVKMAKDYGVLDISLITNGQLLDRRTSRKLMEAGLTRLMVSVDAGSPDTYERVRPGGDFSRLLGNLGDFLSERRALGSELPVLRVSFVELPENQEDKDNFLAIFSQLSDYIVFQDYQDLLSRNDGPTKVREGICREPFTRLALHANGGLFPCCSDYGRLYPVGYFPEMSLKEAWDSVGANLTRIPSGAAHPSCGLCLGTHAPCESVPSVLGSEWHEGLFSES
ncbi:MAG: radical SAM protein [Deltaproteobacteria bacterium]|nr:radical SAM protein [Deltaproteobacteria bacterium]